MNKEYIFFQIVVVELPLSVGTSIQPAEVFGTCPFHRTGFRQGPGWGDGRRSFADLWQFERSPLLQLKS